MEVSPCLVLPNPEREADTTTRARSLSLLRQTLNDRAGFLSNYEVLHLLRQQQQDRIIQLKHLTGGKIGDVGGNGKDGKRPRYQDIAQREEAERIQPQDLHTVSWEVSKE